MMGAIDGPCIFLFSMLSVFWVGGSPLSARGVPAQVLQPAAAPLCLSLFQTTIWGTGCYQPSVTEMTTCNLILSTPGLSLEKTLKLLDTFGSFGILVLLPRLSSSSSLAGPFQTCTEDPNLFLRKA